MARWCRPRWSIPSSTTRTGRSRMSEPVSAMAGASHDGIVRVEDAGLHGMITLRGDLSSAKLKKAVKAAVGADVPAQRMIASAGEKSVAWMSPDELLLLVPYSEVGISCRGLRRPLRESISL